MYVNLLYSDITLYGVKIVFLNLYFLKLQYEIEHSVNP